MPGLRLDAHKVSLCRAITRVRPLLVPEKSGRIACLMDTAVEVVTQVRSLRNFGNVDSAHSIIARKRMTINGTHTDACPDLEDALLQDGGSLYFVSDKVHGPPPDGLSNTQADIFSDVQDMVLDTLEGLSGCIMAYGQTG